MKKKLIIVAIALLIAAVIVAALVIIPKTGLPALFAPKIKVGITENSPFSYMTSDNEASGFSADIAKKAFAELNYNVIFVKINDDEKLSALKKGTIDCCLDITSLGIQQAYYSKDYISCVQGTFYKSKNVLLGSSNDLSKYRCAYIAGSDCEDYLKKAGAVGIPAANPKSAVDAVNEGKADLCIIDNYFINDFINNRTSYTEFRSGIYLYNQKHYFIFSEKKSGLADRTNELIKKYKKDGTIKSLLEQYGLTEFSA